MYFLYHTRGLFRLQAAYAPVKGGISVDTYYINKCCCHVDAIYEGEEPLQEVLLRFLLEYLP